MVKRRLLQRGLIVKLPEGDQPLTLSLFDQIGRKTHQKKCAGSRKVVYEAAREEHPERWSGDIRNWDRPETVSLNPDKSDHQKKQELTQTQS